MNTLSSILKFIGTRLKTIAETEQATATSISELKRTVIKKQSVTLTASGARLDGSRPGYPYVVSIPIAGCTAQHIPDVYPEAKDAGLFAPVCESLQGEIKVWVTRNDFATITIPTIKLIKEA